MKNAQKSDHSKIKPLLVLLIILFSTVGLNAQVIILDYMKVKDGKFNEYLEVEKAWSKVHQKLIDKGILTSWTLYGKMISGTNDEYDYITVNVFPDWKSYEKPYPEDIIQYFNDSLGTEIMNKTEEVRDLIKAEVYTGVALAENSKPDKYGFLIYMNVDHRNFQKYIDLENKYYKPYHEAIIESGGMNSWGIYQRIIPWGGDFNFVAYQGYESLGQTEDLASDAYEAAWEKVANSMTPTTPKEFHEQLDKETYDAREMVHSELWRLIMTVE